MEKKHRCGGTLYPREIEVCEEGEGLVLRWMVPSLVCDKCSEQLLERETVIAIQRSRTPAATWRASEAPVTSAVTFAFSLSHSSHVTVPA